MIKFNIIFFLYQADFGDNALHHKNTQISRLAHQYARIDSVGYMKSIGKQYGAIKI